MKAYVNDPMQVNTRRNWAPEKATIGLRKGVDPGPTQGIQAGIQWLMKKAYLHDKRGTPAKFQGWGSTVREYNGHSKIHSDPNYVGKVAEQYLDLIAQ